MKCAVLFPLFQPTKQPYYEWPLGLSYLITTLKLAGHEVRGFNWSEGTLPTKEDFAWAEVVMLGGLCTHFSGLRKAIADLKTIAPHATIILGGGIVSGTPELTMQLTGAHYGLVGECEEALPPLLERIASGTAPRLTRAKPIGDIDGIPWPSFDELGIGTFLDNQVTNACYQTSAQDRPRVMPIIGSRGCPFSCTFCFHPIGRRYRRRSVEGLCAEIEHYRSVYDINTIALYDEVLAIDKEHFTELLKGLKSFKIPWTCQLRVDAATDETIAAMKEAGCFYISWGVESMSRHVLASMKKKITPEQIDTALRLSWKHGIGIQANLIFGDPAETDESIAESLAWWSSHRHYGVHLSRVSPYPNSPLFRRYCMAGLLDAATYLESDCSANPAIEACSLVSSKGAVLLARAQGVAESTPRLQTRVRAKDTGEMWLNKAKLYEITTTCPWCFTPFTRRRMLIRSPIPLVICPHCNQKISPYITGIS